MTISDWKLGPAAGARVDQQQDQWTLVLVRELKHRPEVVWEALTDPDQLKHWAPFEASANLGVAGSRVSLVTVGAPHAPASTTVVARAEAPHALEYDWGGRSMRWELEPDGSGTRLTLWAVIDKNYIAMGAAGWHLCLAVLDRQLAGDPVGRIVGPEAARFDEWHRLHREYQALFGVKTPGGNA